MHLAVDAETGEIAASDLTVRRTHDCTQVPPLLGQIADPIASLSADAAYDTRSVYEAAHGRGNGRAVRVLIPPGRDAQLSSHPSIARQERNRNVRSIRELGRRGHRSDVAGLPPPRGTQGVQHRADEPGRVRVPPVRGRLPRRAGWKVEGRVYKPQDRGLRAQHLRGLPQDATRERRAPVTRALLLPAERTLG